MALAVGSAQAQSLTDFFPGTREEELKQIKSPDGRSTAILTDKERHGWVLPPEGAKTFGRWARLKVIRAGKTVYDSGDEPLNLYQMEPGFALDLVWSPDSTHIAYRHINTLRIIGPGGKAANYSIGPEDFIIASFTWIDNQSLMVVSKKGPFPLESHDKPYQYEGYTERAVDIRISRLHLTGGQTVRYRQPLHSPTFIFHSVDFCPTEISPKSDRVAFSDGVNLCVYDDTAGKVIAQFKIPQKPTKVEYSPDADAFTRKVDEEMAAEPDQLNGIWWQSNSRLVVGLELLGRQEKRAFYTFDIPSQKLTDVTKALLPVWQDYFRKSPKYAGVDWFGWQDPDWYRAGIQ